MQSKPTTLNLQEGVLDFVEFSKHITILNGKDWEGMSEEEQLKLVDQYSVVLLDFLQGFIADYGDEKMVKEFALVLRVAKEKETVKMSPELTNIVDLAMQALITNMLESNEE